jgi:sulfite reductase (NADPH) flavoprotein alpha-component
MDSTFERLGAVRIHKRIDIDLEDQENIDKWFDGVLQAIPKLNLEGLDSDYLWEKANSGTLQKKSKFDRRHPYYASLKEKKLITLLQEIDDKETLHFEFDLGDSAIQYTVGDSLGVVPLNCATQVEELIAVLGFDPTTAVATPSWNYPEEGQQVAPDRMSLKEILIRYYDVKTIKIKLLQTLLASYEAKIGLKQSSQVDLLKELLAGGSGKENKKLSSYIYGREVIDVIIEFGSLPLNDFLNCLGQLLPRYYSISSTMMAQPGSVTITVAVVRYQSYGRARKGVATSFLADRIEVGKRVGLFVNNNPDFRLPTELNKDIIMVGPGTGVAPFMGMIKERVATGATGKNVLFFGSRFASRDFLYKEELEEFSKQGKLILHTAFSRETKQKIYVQHRVKEQSELIWNGLQNGAHLYICGDAQNMAGDVQKVLVEIVSQYGKMDSPSAEKYLHDLETRKRFQKDVWF